MHKEEEEERIDNPLTPSTPTFDPIIATNTLVNKKEEQKVRLTKRVTLQILFVMPLSLVRIFTMLKLLIIVLRRPCA